MSGICEVCGQDFFGNSSVLGASFDEMVGMVLGVSAELSLLLVLWEWCDDVDGFGCVHVDDQIPRKGKPRGSRSRRRLKRR